MSAPGEPKSENGKPEDLPSVEDDSAYVNSYSNYSIHLEMLQVGRKMNLASKFKRFLQ